MKILNVLAQLPMKTGSGVYFSNLVEELNAQGHENILLYGVQAPYSVDVEGKHYPVEFKSEKIPFPIAGMSDIMPYESTIYSEMTEDMIDLELSVFREVLEKIRDTEGVDLVITHHLFFLSSLVREVFKDTPVVSFCHGTDLRQLERFPRFLERCGSIKDLDMIFTVSPNESEKIHEIFSYDRDKIKLVGGGFNQNIFNRNYEKLDDGILRVCYAGKLSRSKGVYELARSFPLVKKNIDNLEYHIIGATSDEEKRRLYNLAENLEGFKVYDAEDQVTMAKHLKKCDVFVLPSYYEALGLIAIEAMATGLYAVTSEIEGLRAELGDKVNESGLILYTELPTIYDLDNPCEEEVPAYVERLAKNIEIQLKKVEKKEEIGKDIMDIIDGKSWANLAKRIEKMLIEVENDRKTN